jgi:hypothetical protein
MGSDLRRTGSTIVETGCAVNDVRRALLSTTATSTRIWINSFLVYPKLLYIGDCSGFSGSFSVVLYFSRRKR